VTELSYEIQSFLRLTSARSAQREKQADLAVFKLAQRMKLKI